MKNTSLKPMPDRQKILVTGSLAYDHLFSHDGIFRDVVLPEHLHHLNVCFLIKERRMHFGGTGGNIAYNLRLLSEESLLIGVAGNDFSGYETWLHSQKIDTRMVKIIAEKPTASAYITTDRHGNQICNFYPGAMAETPKIDLVKVKNDVSLAIIAPDNTKRMMDFVHQCHHLHLPYVFDPGQNLPEISSADLSEALHGARALILNEYELELLLDTIGVTKKKLFSFIELLIVTRGEKGSTIESVDRKEEIDIAEPKQALDPTGCGDAYRAGILLGLKENYSRKKMGQVAALLATYNLEQYGTQNHRFTMGAFAKRYEESFKEAL